MQILSEIMNYTFPNVVVKVCLFMQKKLVLAVVGGLALLMVFFFGGMSTSTDDGQNVSVLNNNLTVVIQQEKKKLFIDKTTVGNSRHLFPPVVFEALDSEPRKNLVKHMASDGEVEITSSSVRISEERLDRVLKSVPINYHAILYWNDGQDEELIDDYNKVTENSAPDVTELNNENIAEALSSFIYQHELSTQIILEYLDCSQIGCVIYGVELQSGIWNQLIDSARNQTWWIFSKNSTRSSVGANGNLIFFTVIR